jgi:DNA (cytosine-5)-methyltransferase 1
MMILEHVSMFNGLGGFQLAAEKAGWNNYMSCEIDSFCSKVTKYHYPNCIQENDIKKTDFTIYRGLIDVLSGGFPCQPFSVSGKREGTEDERHLWPEMLRAIQEIQPPWVIGENVRGIVNWSEGLVFEQVQADLENEGYEVQPFILPAASVNAPHKRDRVWFVAYNYKRNRTETRFQAGRQVNVHSTKGYGSTTNPDSIRRGKLPNPGQPKGPQNSNEFSKLQSGFYTESFTANTHGKRLQGNRNERQNKERENSERYARQMLRAWHNFPTQPPLCSRNDGISSRLDGITFPAWRAQSVKGYGNAIVPELALQIFKSINEFIELQP